MFIEMHSQEDALSTPDVEKMNVRKLYTYDPA